MRGCVIKRGDLYIHVLILLSFLYLLLLQVPFWDRESKRDVLSILDDSLAGGRDLHRSFRMEALAITVSPLLYGQITRRAAVAACHSVPGLLASDTEALLLHEGDGTLLRRIERIRQGAFAIDRVGEIVTHIGVDLVDGRSPVEAGIHLIGRLLEYGVDHLVAEEWLGAVHRGRA